MGRTYRFVTRDRDRHGNVRLYFRKPGSPKVRLPGPEGSDAFLAAYADAIAGRLRPKVKRATKGKGTFEWLVDRYMDSLAWRGLDEKTQIARRGILQRLAREYGDLPFATMKADHVRGLRDRAHTERGPHGANNVVKILRGLFKWAIEERIADANPATDVSIISTASQGFHSWTLAEVARYERHHPVGTMARLAFDLMLYTGQRRSDAIRLGPNVVENRLVLTQHKGRNRKPVRVEFPILPALAAVSQRPRQGKTPSSSASEANRSATSISATVSAVGVTPRACRTAPLMGCGRQRPCVSPSWDAPNMRSRPSPATRSSSTLRSTPALRTVAR